MNKEVEILATMAYQALDNINLTTSSLYPDTIFLLDNLKRDNIKYKTEIDEDGEEILIEDGVKDEKLKKILDKISKQLYEDKRKVWDYQDSIKKTIVEPVKTVKQTLLIYVHPEMRKKLEKRGERDE